MKKSFAVLDKNTLYLKIENKLGALERVLNTFTLRGIRIINLIYTQNTNPNFVDLKITLSLTDFELEKLVKTLYNQIYVIEIHLVLEDNQSSYVAIAS